ncbi:MAG TPA: hypothetical protein ENI33_09430 [Thermoplasmatales archaeon]|nr:hypothetical protein [Thermoplasmatales archaeon]
MHVKCKVLIECESIEKAEIINNSIKIDNEDYVKTEVKENFILAEIETDKILSLLHTLDDLLSCISLSIKIVDSAHKKF